MFSFCSHGVKPHPATGKQFFWQAARQDRRGDGLCVDVGEKNLPEGEASAAIRR
jgi:hypothetical protein